MRACGSSLLPCFPLPFYPRSPGSRRLYPISTHTASADEGGNESRGSTEVNYQIDVRPQPTTPSPATPARETLGTWTRPRARVLSRRIGNNFVAVMRPESMISSPTARRCTKTRSFRKHDYRGCLMVIRHDHDT